MADAQHAYQWSELQIQSFFTKQQKVLVPPTVPTLDCVIIYTMELFSSQNSSIANSSNASTIDMLANDLLTELEKSINNLPKTLPNMSEADDIAVFT
jgi:hypothetical protein